jgi:tRNA(adenine34) deaminase
LWEGLDAAWREAFHQAWEALRTGNIAVGACASTPDGEIIYAARNRISDDHGPLGEVWGSAAAHAEINVLARLPFRQHRNLTLTTTLEPCLQCAGAIRVGPIGAVRFAGADRYWDGCADFGKLSEREAQRPQAARHGPRNDELGTFATLISRLHPWLAPGYQDWLYGSGEGAMIDLAQRLEADGEVARLAEMEVDQAFTYLWPRLQALQKRSSPPGPG